LYRYWKQKHGPIWFRAHKSIPLLRISKNCSLTFSVLCLLTVSKCFPSLIIN
jgi:hypothetical protein